MSLSGSITLGYGEATRTVSYASAQDLIDKVNDLDPSNGASFQASYGILLTTTSGYLSLKVVGGDASVSSAIDWIRLSDGAIGKSFTLARNGTLLTRDPVPVNVASSDLDI